MGSFLNYQLKGICKYLGVSPKWHISSALEKDNRLRGKEKVLAICEELGATHYVNAPGGRALYEKEEFVNRGVQLSFLEPRAISYRQVGSEFVPNLSIIDVMMFNNITECSRLLAEYKIG